jgi:hypothetical protein
MKALALAAFLLFGGVLLPGLVARGRVEPDEALRAKGSGLMVRPAPSGSPIRPVVVSGAATAILGLLLLLKARGSIRPAAFVAFLLVLETVDLARWKIQLLGQDTISLSDPQYALQELRPLPFIPRRNPDYEASERYRTLREYTSTEGARYDLTDVFVHLDPPFSRFRTNYWLAPFEALVQAHNGNPVDARLGELPAFRNGIDSTPPDTGGPYSKIIGMSMDKLQVFSKAHVADSDQALADVLNRPGFKGDVLLLTRRASGTSGAPLAAATELLAENERISAKPQVLHFDLNRLSLKVELPPGQDEAWLSYSDVWDPAWRATVNGRTVPVERAFLAYKAVKLEPGTNLVEFRIRAPFRIWSYRLVGLFSFFWLGCTPYLAWRLFGKTAARPGNEEGSGGRRL